MTVIATVSLCLVAPHPCSRPPPVVISTDCSKAASLLQFFFVCMSIIATVSLCLVAPHPCPRPSPVVVSTDCSKTVPLLQFLFVCISIIATVSLCLVAPHPCPRPPLPFFLFLLTVPVWFLCCSFSLCVCHCVLYFRRQFACNVKFIFWGEK